MKKNNKKFKIFILGIWIGIILTIFSIKISNYIINSNYLIDSKILRSWSTQITVKVFCNTNESEYFSEGSGVLFAKKNNTYSVLTNSHVINSMYNCKIKTYNNKIYDAKINKDLNQEKLDIAILTFSELENEYKIVSLSRSSKFLGTNIYASGFPIDSKKIKILEGNLDIKLNKPLIGRYQIGYKLDIEQGMSGGPIISYSGKLIGINGRRNNPIGIFEKSHPIYKYIDGTTPNILHNELDYYSWGIPTENFNNYLPKEPYLISMINLFKNKSLIFIILIILGTITPYIIFNTDQIFNIKKIKYMEKFTVKIKVEAVNTKKWKYESTGVIIGKDSNNSYYVLTTGHSIARNNKYKVITQDGKKHDCRIIKYEDQIRDQENKKLDAAIITFKETKDYTLPFLNSDEESLISIYSLGWNKYEKRKFIEGIIGEYDAPYQISVYDYINVIYYYLKNEKNRFEVGMSGSPIINQNLEVIGIHAYGANKLNLRKFKGISIYRLLPTLNKIQNEYDQNIFKL